MNRRGSRKNARSLQARRCALSARVSHGAFGGDHAATSPTWLHQAGGHCGGDRDWTRSLWRPRAWLEPRGLQTVAALTTPWRQSSISAIDRGEAPTHLTSCSALRGPGACQGLIASDETRLLPDHLTWWRLAATQDDIAEILADWSERRW